MQLDENTANTATVRPVAAAAGAEERWWQKRDVGGGQTGTTLDEDWFNDLLGNIRKLLADAGITRTKGSAGDSDLSDAISSLGTPRGYKFGGGMTWTGARTLDVADGTWKSADDARRLHWTSTLTLDLDSSGAGGRGDGVSLTADTWYHVFVAENSTTLAVIVFADTSVIGANVPSGHAHPRRIGSPIWTDGSSNMRPFLQHRDSFEWGAAALALDLDTDQASTDEGDVAVKVPPGIVVEAHLATYASSDAGVNNSVSATFYPKDSLRAAVASNSAWPLNVIRARNEFGPSGSNDNIEGAGELWVLTDTAQTIRYEASSDDGTLRVATLGWRDAREF